MVYLLDQVHFHFISCLETLLPMYPTFRHLFFCRDDFTSMVVVFIHVENLVYHSVLHFQAIPASYTGLLRPLQFEEGFEPIVIRLVGDLL